MSPSRQTLSKLNRTVRAVELPAGSTVHVRDLSIAELRRIDSRSTEVTDTTESNIRTTLLICAYALCEPDGSPLFEMEQLTPDQVEQVIAEVEELTPSQIQAITAAAVPSKADAKN